MGLRLCRISHKSHKPGRIAGNGQTHASVKRKEGPQGDFLTHGLYGLLAPIHSLVPENRYTQTCTTLLHSGCRIPVVRYFWEVVDGVRFSAPRQILNKMNGAVRCGVRFSAPGALGISNADK